MKVSLLVFAGGALIGCVSAAAITSLYIPDTDPQSLSVDVLGVGSDGATTYFIQPIGTDNSSPPGTVQHSSSRSTEENNPLSETLVANANHAILHASITGEDIVFTDDCAIGNDLIASCTIVAVMSGTTSTDFEVETATPIPVVLGSVASPSSTTAGSNSTATPGSTAASPPLSTSPAGNDSSTNPAPASAPNGAVNVKSTMTGFIVFVALNLFGVSML